MVIPVRWAGRRLHTSAAFIHHCILPALTSGLGSTLALPIAGSVPSTDYPMDVVDGKSGFHRRGLLDERLSKPAKIVEFFSRQTFRSFDLPRLAFGAVRSNQPEVVMKVLAIA
jgi:hypothetical protein